MLKVLSIVIMSAFLLSACGEVYEKLEDAGVEVTPTPEVDPTKTDQTG